MFDRIPTVYRVNTSSGQYAELQRALATLNFVPQNLDAVLGHLNVETNDLLAKRDALARAVEDFVNGAIRQCAKQWGQMHPEATTTQPSTRADKTADIIARA